MMQESFILTEQLLSVLDHAPVSIYVSAIGSWELLYANSAAKDLMLAVKEGPGITCYEAAGLDGPCSFCQTEKMDRTGFLVREFRRPSNGRVYELSGKIIDWAGVPAHIEYILDITDRKREEERSEELKLELQKTFSSVPCGLCVYRADGNGISPLFHNPAFYDIMGYSAEHIGMIEQQTDFLGVHPDDVDTLKKRIWEAVSGSHVMQCTYRLWNDREDGYRWIHLAGSVKSQEDGSKLLYGVYSDVSGQMKLEQDLTAANEKMQDIINAIPGGVAIYKVTDIFETVYFSDGVPELSGHTVEEYQEFLKQNAADMIYHEDAAMVEARAMEVIRTHEIARFEFRKQHRNGHVVWVRVQIKWIGEDQGYPLLHCVFHNITDLKEAQLEMNHLINAIPGGIASYRVEGGRFISDFYSDGVIALSGHTREEFDRIIENDALNVIYEQDKVRVMEAVHRALVSGELLDVSYRIRHRDGNLMWIHLSGRRMGPLTESTRFYAVFTGISEEARLFQDIANETADGIYVIDRDNYDLLYVNESKELFVKGKGCLGQKCYAALHGKEAPCEFCTVRKHELEGLEHEMTVEGQEYFYITRFRETDWNGIPAYIKYVRDATEEIRTRMEKERLEIYFQTMIANLPGGISVMRCEKNGGMVPEYISEGFAAMIHMPVEEIHKLLKEDIFAGCYPEDIPGNREKLAEYMDSGQGHCELTARMKGGDGSCIWVKSTLSLLQTTDGTCRLYIVYTDITRTVEEKERIQEQFEDILLQHYRAAGPDELILGHCDITRNHILEIIDYTDSDLLKTFGDVREEFFTGISGLVVEEEQRQTFLSMYLNEPALAAFHRNDTEQILDCFVKLPKDDRGRYVRFKVNLIEAPDTGDITGVLTVTDITRQTISDLILHQMSAANYDFVVDLDLDLDFYKVQASYRDPGHIMDPSGRHSEHIAYMLRSVIVPNDKERYADAMEPAEIRRRLTNSGSYTFSFSITDDKGDIRTKSMTVSAVDLRLGRVCLVRTDITDSIREQQGLLNMIAYTFELAGFLNLGSGSLTLYTRQTVLKNLSPDIVENYDGHSDYYMKLFGVSRDGQDSQEMHRQFFTETMLEGLAKKPEGYDFVFSFQSQEGPRYKQINVLWGDENHRTICLVQADVTDMLLAERRTKETLETALALAEEASRAKTVFLSHMSHDIRTPINGIMGMADIATRNMEDPDRVENCLEKITAASRHLLSLVNDVLDMSRIESGKVELEEKPFYMAGLLDGCHSMVAGQAFEKKITLIKDFTGVKQNILRGDELHIRQILINILGNAVKFTPEGGEIDFIARDEDSGFNESEFTVMIRDTGIGMSQELQSKLFEPFVQENTSRSQYQGTGLGMSIVKQLLDLMGGSIEVESAIGKGSTFTVRLRLPVEAGEVRKTWEDSQEADLSGMRVLLVEDNDVNMEIARYVLEDCGVEVTPAINGREALDLFVRQPEGSYDLILMDVMMPVMGGLEATRAIRASHKGDAGTIPIVAMTANAYEEDRRAALKAGMNQHLTKPMERGELIRVLCELRSKNR